MKVFISWSGKTSKVVATVKRWAETEVKSRGSKLVVDAYDVDRLALPFHQFDHVPCAV